MKKRIVIVGAGPAGYTAALYAARSGLEPLLVAGDLSGGQLLYTHHIENFPGIENVAGIDLIETMQRQLKHVGVEVLSEHVIKADLKSKPIRLEVTGGTHIETDALVIATGSSPKWLNVPGEEEFRGRGISICATCDGFFMRGKDIAIVGGGNTAIYEAVFMATLAKSVTIILHEGQLTAEKALQEKIETLPNVKVMYHTNVVGFEGSESLENVLIKDARTHVHKKIPIQGVFVAIGQIPNSGVFKGQLKCDDKGFIVTDCRTRATSVPGVFAAGDVQESYYRQAIIACGSGASAALSAEHYLLHQK